MEISEDVLDQLINRTKDNMEEVDYLFKVVSVKNAVYKSLYDDKMFNQLAHYAFSRLKKKAIKFDYSKSGYPPKCPTCSHILKQNQKACDECGQMIDWEKIKD